MKTFLGEKHVSIYLLAFGKLIVAFLQKTNYYEFAI